MNNDKIHISVFDSNEHRGIKNILTRNFRELITYRYAIYNFISSNLRSRYRRSTLGFLWSLLNPLITMAMMTIVFSTIFQNSMQNFSVYIFSGLLPWTLISNSMIDGSMSLIAGETYLKKVYIPRFVFPLVTVGVEVANFLLRLISLFFLAFLLGAKISWALTTLPFALLLTALFILGLVLIVSILTVYFRDLSHITQIGFTALFYLTPIIYPVEFLSSNPLLLTMVKSNPFFYFVELFHSILYQAKTPDLVLWSTCLGLTVVSLILGFIVFSSREQDVIYRL